MVAMWSTASHLYGLEHIRGMCVYVSVVLFFLLIFFFFLIMCCKSSFSLSEWQPWWVPQLHIAPIQRLCSQSKPRTHQHTDHFCGNETGKKQVNTGIGEHEFHYSPGQWSDGSWVTFDGTVPSAGVACEGGSVSLMCWLHLSKQRTKEWNCRNGDGVVLGWWEEMCLVCVQLLKGVRFPLATAHLCNLFLIVVCNSAEHNMHVEMC